MKPLISIIIPIYNAENYIRKCIDSLINQTYKNIEIILINDGSTDTSASICDLYKKQDKRVFVFHKKNQGVSSTRNEGLKLAKGDFISFIDSDDWLELDAYQILVDIIKKYKVDAVIFEYSIDYLDGKIILKPHKKYNGILNSEKAVELTVTSINRSAWSKIYSKNIVQGIKFDRDIHFGEDILFACSVLKNAKSVYYLSKPIYHYIQSEIGVTRCEFNEKWLSGVKAYFKLFELCEKFYPQLTTISLSVYINMVMIIIYKLHDSLYPNRKNIIKNLKTEIYKYGFKLLFSTQTKMHIKLKLFVCLINTKLYHKLYRQMKTLND